MKRNLSFYLSLCFSVIVMTLFFIVHPPLPFPIPDSAVKTWNKANVCIVTYVTDKPTKYSELAMATKKEYAQKFGYEFVVKHVADKSWNTIQLLLETIEEYPEIEWFWLTEQNTIITNKSLDLDIQLFQHLHGYDGRELLATYDCHGFNTDSLVVHNAKWPKRFLSMVNKLVEDGYKISDAISLLINQKADDIAQKVFFLPTRSINSRPKEICKKKEKYKWRPGDFVINMSGCNITHSCSDTVNSLRSMFDIV